MPPRIAGLDLSLTSTGVALVERGHPPQSVALGSEGKATATLPQRHRRLTLLADKIIDATTLQGPPDLVVIEAPAYSRGTGHMHDRSGLWWLVVSRILTLGYPLIEVGPNLRAKYATGKGNAGKAAVMIAVTRRYPDCDFTTDDEADALVLAAIGSRLLGHPLEDSLPKPNLEALKTLEAPHGD